MKRFPFILQPLRFSTFCLSLFLWITLYSSALYSASVYIVDTGERLGTVDLSTGSVNVIGPMDASITDIATDAAGRLYGISFNNLYKVSPLTASATLIGPHVIPSGNALEFGSDDTLYGAGNSYRLFTIQINTGESTSIGTMGYDSWGDLAFHNGELFLTSSVRSQLVKIDLENNAQGTVVGTIGYSNVYGLATATDGVLYGVSGTTIFSVNTETGVGTFVLDYSGHGLGSAVGMSAVTQTPVPAGALLMGSGLIALLSLRKARKN